MARLGKRPVEIPEGVKGKVENNRIIIEGPKGKLEKEVLSYLKVEIIDNNKIFVKNIIPEENRKLYKKGGEFQGLMRSLIKNMVVG
ncbi:MAG TPA: 50S ribosomal protein L6, partial [Candidatus Ratteibacteria bacterium]|nr:50S ribosomal protein L6 [Candidatus Ratteibacteria bacterium]